MKTFGEIFAEAEQHLVECIKAGQFILERRESTQVHIIIEGAKFVIWCSPFGAKYYSLFGGKFIFPITEETKQLLYSIFKIDDSERERLKLFEELELLRAKQVEVEEKLKKVAE